ASILASASPNPDAAPVTITTLPLTLPIFCLPYDIALRHGRTNYEALSGAEQATWVDIARGLALPLAVLTSASMTA
ncbi:MAG: hypothetical protein ACI8PP_000483, partial [Candidatus Pseudothioglobus sp.]